MIIKKTVSLQVTSHLQYHNKYKKCYKKYLCVQCRHLPTALSLILMFLETLFINCNNCVIIYGRFNGGEGLTVIVQNYALYLWLQFNGDEGV